MKKTHRRLAALTLIPLTFLACSGLEPASTGDAAKRAETRPQVDKAAAAPEQAAAARALTEALHRRLAEKASPGDLYIEAECYDEDETFRSVQVYGDGLAIWDGEVQFSVDDGEVRQMLEAFGKLEFTTMKDLYGSSAMRIICRVVLELDGVRKQVAQRARGEQNETLKTLANDIFDIAREPAHAGLKVPSLADGLEKIARGELNPRIFDLMVHRKPERTAEMAGKNVGWLFRLTGLEAVTRIYNDGKLGDSMALDIGDVQLIALANLLTDTDVVNLPQNLYADKYTDVVVRVLKYETRVQARQFAGMTSSTHGEKQERFDRMLAAIRDLHERTAHEGTVRLE